MQAIDHQRRNVGRTLIVGGAAALMLLPVLPERFAGEVPWDVGDFVFLALLLVGVAGAYELVTRIPRRWAYRGGIIVGLVAGLLQSWINLAVGVIGSEDNPANWIYFGVSAVALTGCLLARFRAQGMALAMSAAALAQVLAFVAAWVVGLGFTGPITVFFAALWLAAAWLFRRAA